jgi:hypothetical protein
MNTYQANVRINNTVVQTRVQAASEYQAKLLLASQYGASNIIGFVQLVH